LLTNGTSVRILFLEIRDDIKAKKCSKVTGYVTTAAKDLSKKKPAIDVSPKLVRRLIII